VVGAVLSVVALSGATVVPQAAADEWTQEQINARYQQYRARINQLLDEGKTPAEVDLTIAQEFGIVRLASDATNQIVPSTDAAATTASNITMYQPTFSYDSLLHKNVMAASWAWKTCPTYNRACWTNDGGVGPMGGPDGMALNINLPTTRSSVGISTNDNCGTPVINNTQPDTANSYGVAFIEQDTVRYNSANGLCAGTPYRYDWHRGTISGTFTFNGSCAGHQVVVDSRIGHTWSSTAVTSIGIFTSGISFSWSSTNYRWNAQPTAPVTGYC
jgi:hypothetical protein